MKNNNSNSYMAQMKQKKQSRFPRNPKCNTMSLNKNLGAVSRLAWTRTTPCET